VPVADQGERDDARPGSAGPLEKPSEEQDVEPGRQDGEKRAAEVKGKAERHRRLAAGCVRHRPVEQLPDAEGEEKGGQDQLAIVGIVDPKLGGNVAKGRQHRIDRERDQ
jgi:hypothetical protein